MTKIDRNLRATETAKGWLTGMLRFDMTASGLLGSASLTTLAARLGAGEALSLRYVLDPGASTPLRVALTLTLCASSAEALTARRRGIAEAAEDAVLMAFGGGAINWTGTDWIGAPLPAGGPWLAPLPPRFLELQQAGRCNDRRHLRTVFERSAARLPMGSVFSPDVDRLLIALTTLGRQVCATVVLRPLRLDGRDLRRLSELDAWLLATGAGPSGSCLSEREHILAQLAVSRWREAGEGIDVRFALETMTPIPAASIDMLGAALHRQSPRPPVREAGTPELDLAHAWLADDPTPGVAATAACVAAFAAIATPRAHCRAVAGIPIGATLAGTPVLLNEASRSRHLFICGATGVGKSSLLSRLALADIAAGKSVVLVDPHGDLVSEIEAAAPGQVLVANAADFEAGFTLNLLETSGPHPELQRSFIANQLIRVLKRTLYAGVPEAFGPMFEAYFRNALMLLMAAGGPDITLAGFERVFSDPAYRRELLDACEDEAIVRFWRGIALKAGGEAALENIAPYITSKLTQFTGNPLMHRIVSAPRSSLDFAGEMARGEARLIALGKGALGETDAELLGGLIVTRLFSAALARARIRPEERRPVRVYLDEFQSYGAETIGAMLAECRKYGLEITLATQSLASLRQDAAGVRIAEAVLGNVANIIAFRSGPGDARLLADWMGDVDPAALMRLDDHEACARLFDGGRMRPITRFRATPPD